MRWMFTEGSKIPPPVFKPLWEYIPSSQYDPPAAPTRETVRKGLSLFWERLQTKSPAEVVVSQELRSIPRFLLNWAAPPPSSTQGKLALQTVLQNWLVRRNPQFPVQVIIGPPGSGVEQVVRDLGQHMQWRCIAPPTPEEILAGGEEWLDQIIHDGDDPLVIPQLGKCYLRHHDGLDLMNRLLDWLAVTERHCLLACDSWAWAFLVRSLQIDAMLPISWSLAPFHAARLQFWLPLLARRTYKGAFVFRYADSGQLVFPVVERDELDATRHPAANKPDKYADWLNIGYFLKQLAAHSRGIPGVAWAYWRECLRIAADADVDESVLAEAQSDEGYTVWVQSWSQLKLPFVPAWASTPELFVLHALLLHGGMTAELLDLVLPLSDNEVRQIMYRLRNARLVNNVNHVWRVTLLGYPGVRQFLASEGYLVDEF